MFYNIHLTTKFMITDIIVQPTTQSENSDKTHTALALVCVSSFVPNLKRTSDER